MISNNNNLTNICIYGVGGVGGYFGGKIADADQPRPEKLSVAFIARGAHLAAIQTNGLKVITPEKTIFARPTLATAQMEAIPFPDLVLLCVKSYDLEKALTDIRAKTTEKTIIIPLLNGVDIYDRVRARLDQGIVLPACVYVGTHIQEPGVIAQKGGSGMILLGKDPMHPEVGPERIMPFFNSVNIAFQWNDDPYPAIWSKYIFIAAFGLVSVHTGKTLGAIVRDKASIELVRNIMEEIRTIARGKGISLPLDIVAQSIQKATDFPFETKTSFQRDVESKGPLHEGDLYGGTILRIGAELGIPTPATQSVYTAIRDLTNNHRTHNNKQVFSMSSHF